MQPNATEIPIAVPTTNWSSFSTKSRMCFSLFLESILLMLSPPLSQRVFSESLRAYYHWLSPTLIVISPPLFNAKSPSRKEGFLAPLRLSVFALILFLNLFRNLSQKGVVKRSKFLPLRSHPPFVIKKMPLSDKTLRRYLLQSSFGFHTCSKTSKQRIHSYFSFNPFEFTSPNNLSKSCKAKNVSY